MIDVIEGIWVRCIPPGGLCASALKRMVPPLPAHLGPQFGFKGCQSLGLQLTLRDSGGKCVVDNALWQGDLPNRFRNGRGGAFRQLNN
jgi:hypothetical protein